MVGSLEGVWGQGRFRCVECDGERLFEFYKARPAPETVVAVAE